MTSYPRQARNNLATAIQLLTSLLPGAATWLLSVMQCCSTQLRSSENIAQLLYNARSARWRTA